MKIKLLIILLFFISALFLIPSVIYYLANLQNEENLKRENLSRAIVLPADTRESKLADIAEKHLLNNSGEYAIVIKNLKTGENYFYNENKKFNSASLYKLWIMAVAFQKIKDGLLSEDDVLTLPLSYLDDTLSTTTPTPTLEGFSPSPSLEEEPRFISMSTGDAIERMITISDNYAALLVASRSGTTNVIQFLKDYNFKNSNFRQPPQTTAEDTSLFFEKLYKGEIIDKDYSEKMVDILKNQTLNDRIPKYLQKNTPVAHKTGELFNAKHDAGIVYSSKGDYIIVVLTDTNDVKKAIESIANFSKAVYDYFTTL
ncbi:MAG: serine hydrolase [Candidatus Levybacteria bacterium]|nr:serine hydrolase [Candidatus Levybacteria bacterium]